MLTFIGLGLYDERSVTVEGRDAVRDADRVFAEFYTSRLVGADVADLEAYHDTDIEVVPARASNVTRRRSSRPPKTVTPPSLLPATR